MNDNIIDVDVNHNRTIAFDNGDGIESPQVDSKNIAYTLPMGITKDVDVKYYTRFIKSVERMVRGNPDYKLYLESLRELDLLSKDAFMTNLTSDYVEIQLHHFPINLYNIAHYVTQKNLKEFEFVSTFMIANEVIHLHLNDRVGLVALSATMHELEHITGLPITKGMVFGTYKYLQDNYELSDYDKDRIEKLENHTHLSIEDFRKSNTINNLLEFKDGAL